MPVHVSIHDVSPASSEELETALRLCDAQDVRPALLVVPDFHGRAPLVADPGFCARLRELQSHGHEIYLHGFFHSSGGRYAAATGGRISWLFAQHVASGREAEMSDISPEEGRARIERGEQVLRDAGLRVDGFVAPAWSMPPWLMPLLRARQYRFTEDHLRVYDPAEGRARVCVVLNWATRSSARLVSTLAWCRVARSARALMPVRIAIHPGDMSCSIVRREIKSLFDWARGDFVARGTDLLA